MAALAWSFGILGGLCAVMGILVAKGGIVPSMGEAFTWMFWFVLSGILLLVCIAFSLGRSNLE